MTGPRTTHIPELLEVHYEELQLLWWRRQAALRSPSITMRAFSALEERIEGHVQGLLVAQDRVIQLLEEGLAAEESATAFAAAYPLLRLGIDRARSLVLNAFSSGTGTALDGIRQALCQYPVDVKASRTAALLKHEQGHYDIVALIARDLFNELTGWETPKAPKRFKKETDLKNAADRLRRQAKSLAARLSGTASSVGVYDIQTKHMQDAKAQEAWDKVLETARTSGKKLAIGVNGVAVGTGP